MDGKAASASKPKNRYKDAKRNPDWTIDQDWDSYTDAEHDRWDRLFAGCRELLRTRACDEYLEAVETLRLSSGGISNMERLSDRLEALTGWRLVPVTDLVPDDIFFDHLANRRFPAGAFIRPEEEFDYIEEPDVFHDIFGHVPMLANTVFADFMAAYGQGGRRAMELGMLKNLARLYWYTVEFGLVSSAGGLRIYGAGILSSQGESVFALDDPSPHRIRFELTRVMRTDYIIDDYQKGYFVIDGFDKLLADCYQDFGDLYRALEGSDTIMPGALATGDEVLNKGTLAYFETKGAPDAPPGKT